MTIRPGVLRAAAVSAAVALTLAGCSGGGDEDARGPAAPAAAAGSAGDLKAAGCPSTIVIQGGWFQTMDIGLPFQLLGNDYRIDSNRKRVSGPLVVNGKATGVDIEFRAGGPAVGFQNGPAVAAQDPSINLVFANLDEIIAGWTTAPMRAVVAPMNGDPQAIIFDPAQHPDWNTIADIGQTDTRVLYSNNARAPFAYLVGSGILRPGQVAASYDGSPSQFIAARGTIAVQGYATNEVGVYESLPQWHKPVGYFLVQDSGYPNYAGVLAIRPGDEEKLAPCLRKLVPVFQQAQIDMMGNPGPAEQKIVKSVQDFKSVFQYSAENAEFGMCQIAKEGLVSNPSTGPLGSMQPDKVRRVVDVLRPILTAQKTAVPADLTADTLATNQYLDSTKRLPLAAPSWASSCSSHSG
jgi:hypothetical protein